MKTNALNRRDFIAKSSIGLVGTGVGLMNSGFIGEKHHSLNIAEQNKIKEYRVLGRTGFRVSDIGCGTMGISNENVLRQIIASGVNFLDTAEAYANGNNELMVGRAIKDIPRKNVFINTKIYVGPNDTVESLKLRVQKCLERLQTNYIDGIMIWSASSVETIRNEIFHEAFKQLKSEGRVKYCGVTCHGTAWIEEPRENMEQIIGAAAEDGRFDMVMFVYNYIQQEMGEHILAVCAKKNIGTTLMKTDPFGGAYLFIIDRVKNLQKENQPLSDDIKKIYDKIMENQLKAEAYLQQNNLSDVNIRREAAIGFALNNPSAHSALITFKTFEDIDNYIRLSGVRLTAKTLSLIEVLKETYGHLYCRHACGLCESSCPSQVQVNRIMRYNHYFMAQGREKYAIQKYHEISGLKAENCLDCEGYCEKSCPFGVPVHLLLAVAHQNMSLGEA
ncbi:MAG: aldo/keto reductase [Bacteroidales bacterium]|nr:aldo/keto reductase [Bacteroidales bacterium]